MQTSRAQSGTERKFRQDVLFAVLCTFITVVMMISSLLCFVFCALRFLFNSFSFVCCILETIVQLQALSSSQVAKSTTNMDRVNAGDHPALKQRRLRVNIKRKQIIFGLKVLVVLLKYKQQQLQRVP